jgi:hypothetical protein
MINYPKNFKTYSKPHRPSFIRIIKQRKNHERSIWCSPGSVDKIYSSMFNDKQYIYSFLTPESSKNCFQFLKKYKEVNGHYPDLHGKKYLKDVSDDVSIYIDDENLNVLKKKCLLNNVGLVGISDFSYSYIDSLFGKKNVFNLSISAVDLLDDENVDTDEQIEHLNYLLDF